MVPGWRTSRSSDDSPGVPAGPCGQGGPGGPLDYNTERDAIQGSIPLEHTPNGPAPEATPEPDPTLLSGLAKAAGVHNIADVPMDATPDEAVVSVLQSFECDRDLHEVGLFSNSGPNDGPFCHSWPRLRRERDSGAGSHGINVSS